MEKVLGLGVVALIVASTFVGLRLVWLWRRTREIPELAMGVSFLSLGGLGYPLAIAARSGAADDPGTAGVLLAAALTSQDLASLAVAVATWRTFRPELRGVEAALVLLGFAFVVSLVGHGATVGFHGASDGGAFYYLGFTGRALPFFWAAAEAVRYAQMLQQRLPLGLTSPVVADRFQLWAVSSSAISAGFVVFLAGRVLTPNVGTSPSVLVLTSLVGLVSGATMWLAFAPPRWYMRRVLARPSVVEGA